MALSNDLTSHLESTIKDKDDHIKFQDLDKQKFDRYIQAQNEMLAADQDLQDVIAGNKEFNDLIGEMEGNVNKIVVSAKDYNVALLTYNAMNKDHPISYKINLKMPEVKVNF